VSELIADFSPIADRGELELPTGLRARFRRKAALQPIDLGFKRILVGANGVYADESEQTAGERYWSSKRSWVKVDVRPHTLRYEVPVTDPRSGAGFVAAISLVATVVDATAIAKQGIDTVSSFLEPSVLEAIRGVSIDLEPSTADPIRVLSETRQRVEALLSKALQGTQLHDLPRGLSARITSISVEFDAATQHHHADLIARTRTGELIEADAVNKEKETHHAIAQRQRWRDELSAHLADPARRAFEIVLSDPTPANIAMVVAQANDADRERRGALVEVLQSMIAKDYVDKGDPIYQAAVTLVESLQEGLQVTPPALEGPAAQAAIAKAEPEPEPANDDQRWDD
jgi:hypothetical protein